jgi:RimJ/RimL family protein N-acetyltransferase
VQLGACAREDGEMQDLTPHPWERLVERLEGRLVVLEPLSRAHTEGLFAAARDPEIWRFMPWNARASEASFDSWMEDALKRSSEGLEVPFAIIARATGAPVGSTRYLTLRPEHRGLEIGWSWVAREAWGTGLNVEAKYLLLRHAFEALDCLRVEFKTDALNQRSRVALEALPARFEGIFRKHMVVRGGELRDSAYYAVTDDEWPVVKANLERRLSSR